MLIVVAGMKRSGTTWMYNVVRLGYEQAGRELVLCKDNVHCWEENRDRDVLMKSHWWKKVPADIVLTSDRDPVEVQRSMVRAFGERKAKGEMKRIIAHSRKWKRITNCHVRYESLLRDPVREAGRVLEAVGLYVDPKAVVEAVEAIPHPVDAQDPVSLYFPRHREHWR